MVAKGKRCAVEDFSSRMLAAAIRGGGVENAFNRMDWLKHTCVFAMNDMGFRRVKDRSCDKEFGRRVVLVKLSDKGKIKKVGALEMPQIEQGSMDEPQDFVLPEPVWMHVNQHQCEKDHRMRVLDYGTDGHIWQLQKHIVKAQATIDLNEVTEIVPGAMRMKEDASFVYIEQNVLFNGIYKINLLAECNKPAFKYLEEFIEPSISEPFQGKKMPFFVDSVVSKINKSAKSLLDQVTGTLVVTSKGIVRSFSGETHQDFEPRLIWGVPHQHVETMINPIRIALGPRICVCDAVVTDCAMQQTRVVKCHASPESLQQAIALCEQDTYRTVILALDAEHVDKLSFETNTDSWFLMLEMIMQSSRSFPHVLGLIFQFNAHPRFVSKMFLSTLLDAVVNLPSMERTSPNLINGLSMVKRITCLNMVTDKTPLCGPLHHILEARKFTPHSCGYYQQVRISENGVTPIFVPSIMPSTDAAQLVARPDTNSKLHLVVYDKKVPEDSLCPVGQGWKQVYTTNNQLNVELLDVHNDETFDGNAARYKTAAIVVISNEDPETFIKRLLPHITICALLLRFRPRIVGLTTFQAVRSASLESFENDEFSSSPIPESIVDMDVAADSVSLCTPLIQDLSAEEIFFAD